MAVARNAPVNGFSLYLIFHSIIRMQYYGSGESDQIFVVG